MDKESIENSLEFKLTKKYLLKNYPFIKNVILSPDWEKYTAIYFVDLSIDIETLSDLYDLNIPKGYSPFFSRTVYLVLLSGSHHNEILDEIQNKIKKDLERIHLSSHIPEKSKLDRKISIGEFNTKID